ncbi:MAG TPA: penicillin-binding transpeptidase domain-containing protein [Desulfobacteria bacterium]|nr:penicillin-binding transpeptidase domain-containing protein [Desulfobacteria bacterium]
MKKIILLCGLSLILSFLVVGCSDNSAQRIFAAYANDWQNRNFAAMYAKLTSEAKSNLSQAQFVQRYQGIYDGMGVSGLTVKPSFPAKVTKDKQGKVHFPVNVSMETLAGRVQFTEEVTLIYEKGESGKTWAVAWTPQMILPQLAAGDKVRAERFPAVRGQITDRKGRGLAVNGKVITVGVVPQDLAKKPASKTQMAKTLNIPEKQIDQLIAEPWVKPDYFVPISKLSLQDKTKAAQLAALPGVVEREADARVYPYKEAGAHLIGYTAPISAEELKKMPDQGYHPNSWIGKAGLEQVWEKRLKGNDGGIVYIEDSQGRRKTVVAQKEVQNGENIRLTIDIDLQQSLYEQLKSDKGTAVALQPKTGEVLAMVSAPSYDPNQFELGMTPQLWQSLNDQTQKPLLARFSQSYAPGSTFKLVTAAIGLKSNKLNPTAKVNVAGLKWQKNSTWGNYYVTRIADPGKPVNLADALVYSDNIYFAQAALNIGKETFLAESKNFGLGDTVPFAYPLSKSQISDAAGITDEVQLADTGYGQGKVLTNPLHLALIYSALVNSGDILKPVLESPGTTPQVWKTGVFSPETANLLRQDLTAVVESLKGKAYQPTKQVVIAGKTGTAELKTGLNDPNARQNGWFVAVDTAKPSLLVTMQVEDVQKRGESHYVVPKVMKVMEQFSGTIK